VLAILTLSLLILRCSLLDLDGESTIDPYENISLKEAEQMVIKQVLHDDLDEKIIYELREKMKSGTAILTAAGNGYKVENNSWFFFVDECMDSVYPHSCLYVFVECMGGERLVIDDTVYPDQLLYNLEAYHLICSAQ